MRTTTRLVRLGRLSLGWALWWIGIAVLAQEGTPPAGGAEPAGSGPGASRQAWAAAAMLSRGISVPGLLDPSTDTAGTAAHAARVANTIALAGFRSVHLPVTWPGTKSPGRADAAGDDAFAERLDVAVDAFLARGLGVVLALLPPEPLPGRGATPWQSLARRYAGRSDRLLFEISREPGWAAAPSQARAGLVHLLRLIRQTNPKRIVVIDWVNPIGLPQLPLPDDRNLIVAVGNEEPYRFTHQGVPGLPGADRWLGTTCCNPREVQLMTIPLDLARTWSVEHRYPVWLGGFKSHAGVPLEGRARHARLMREAAEARGLSWAYGDFSGDFGAYDPVARAWRRPLLEALLGP